MSAPASTNSDSLFTQNRVAGYSRESVRSPTRIGNAWPI
jgi:hypothetical protein